MTPIFEPRLQERLLEILELQLSDNDLAFELQNSGEYVKVARSENEKVISCHEVLENYISKIYKSVKKDTDKAKADMLASKLLKES